MTVGSFESTMTRISRPYALRSIFVFLTIVSAIDAAVHDFMNLQHRRSHLPGTKFSSGEYVEYPENEEGEHSPEWDGVPSWNQQKKVPHTQVESTSSIPDNLDPNIAWDGHWTPDLKDMGQISAVDVDSVGRVAIFSRRERVWGLGTFDDMDRFDRKNGPIKHNTIAIYDRTGAKLLEWGKNMFYLPHGLTIDGEGNYWITDVALHQVMKFDAKDIEKNWDLLKSIENEPPKNIVVGEDYGSLYKASIMKPSMILGEAFKPGKQIGRFCKPTSVAVAENGDFFVSDGYCNSRIVKFNKKGEIISHWGRPWSAADNLKKSAPVYTLFVPHSVALAEDTDLLYVADREDGRVIAYHAQNGTFQREFKSPAVGTKIYAIAYARERLYVVNGADVYTSHKFHIRGFVFDTKTGALLSQFRPQPNDMLAPHDIAVSDDGSEIYAVELNAHKVYRFVQDISKLNTSSTSGNPSGLVRQRHEPELLTDATASDASTGQKGTGPLVLSIIISAMILIGLCLAVAVVVARCQKRGCLLSVRRRADWEAERRENFKLSNLLVSSRQGKNFKMFEKRPNPRDFSKLNTEPETSEDERVEDSPVV